MNENANNEPTMSADFNPHSQDSMFARILERMDHQDGTLREILANVQRTNGRVTGLEHWRDLVRAKIGLIASGVAGVVSALVWLADRLLG